MSQPPDDPFYNSQTENASYQSRQWAQQAPGYPGPHSTPNYPPPSGYAPGAGHMNQPSMPAQPYPPQARPTPPFAPQAYPPGQRPAGQVPFTPPSYPLQGPVNQPPFAQQRPTPVYTGQQPPWAATGQQSPGPDSFPGLPPQGFSTPGGNTASRQGPKLSMTNIAPSQPDTKSVRPRKARKGRIIISVLALVLLLAGGAGAFLLVRKGHPQPARPTVHATATPGNTTPITGGPGTVGQPLQAGQNWVVTVTSVHTTTVSDYPPKAGHTYLECNLTLKNVSANKQFVSSLVEFTLADTTGAQYIETVSDTNIRKAVDGTIGFGQTLTGQIAYDVPQSRHQFVLTFSYGLPDGSSEAVSWNLTI